MGHRIAELFAGKTSNEGAAKVPSLGGSSCLLKRVINLKDGSVQVDGSL